MGCSISKSANTGASGSIQAHNKKDGGAGGGGANYPKQQMKPTATITPQQQPAPAPQASQEKKPSALSDAEIKKRLTRYIETDKSIREWEGKNLPKTVQAKKTQLADVQETLRSLEQLYRVACEKVAKEKADVDKMQNPSVKAFFKDQQEFDEKMSKEQEEYLEAVSEQEKVKQQLEGIQTQARTLEKEANDVSGDMNKLLALYDEQDQILDEIFSGHYGSDLENKLEEEVDNLLDRKERIGVAKYKWANGRLLLQHASTQLAFACGRWITLLQVPMSSVQIRYQLATETRNNLIAASQNILSAKRYLNNIKFPYCETEEMATLDRACSNIYIDMRSADRHQHALQCYTVTHRRCAALLQWFDNVITNTIETDLAKSKAELAPKQAQLRKERLRLMQEKIGGTEDLNINDKDITDEFDDDMLEPELVAVSQPDKVEGENQGLLAPAGEGSAPAPTPLPLNELAPPPSQEDLFGNIEQLRKQHEEEMAQIAKTQETNKARMEQGLQEKLRQRRSRRMRMEVVEE